MILFKNKADQRVYTKVITVATGAFVTNASPTVSITKNNSVGLAFTSGQNAVFNHGNGIYSYLMAQEETNCDTGCIIFTGLTAGQAADCIYFETTEENPTVGSVIGNIGTSITPVSMFVNKISTDGATGPTDIRANINNSITNVESIVTGMKAATYNGISQDTLNKLLLAFIAGKAEISAPDGDQVNIKYYQFGTSTELMNINVNFNNGARNNAGTIT